jgi:MraZ protein
MFSGAYEHSVDDKGRTVIPARFRAKLGESFVITRCLHGCLWVFPERAWPDIQTQLQPKTLLDSKGVMLERYFVGSAVDCIPDKPGRVAIPPLLLKHAEIEGEVLIMGLSDKLEIWSKKKWDEFNEKLTDDVIAELGKEVMMSELG